MEQGQQAAVVVVDDESVLVDVVCEMLADAGIIAEGCSSGQQAVESIRTMRPQFIILDLQMPQVDGVTIFRQLRADPETAAIPVIFFTANLDGLRAHIPNYQEQGALVLSKPFREEELLAVVERARMAFPVHPGSGSEG